MALHGRPHVVAAGLLISIWFAVGCVHDRNFGSQPDQSVDNSDRALYEEQKRVSAQQLLEFKQLYERWARLQITLRNIQEELARRQREREEVLRELQAERQARSKRQESKSEDGKSKAASGSSKKEQTRQLKRLLHDLQELLSED
jgi:TolA-binding protein